MNQGELVFITSKECSDITPEQADSYILGYTIGNDLSCRKFQLTQENGGQFYYAKAFDKFAPIGPVLVSPTIYNKVKDPHLTTRVNGQVMQNVDINKDMVFTPQQILSFMSQSKPPSLPQFPHFSHDREPKETGGLTSLFFERHDNSGVYGCYDGYAVRCWCVQET
jgi:hypothetical protein